MKYKNQNCRINQGYYIANIKTPDGTKKAKGLHRQIWEDHYGPIPPRYHVHHRDGNTLNNHIDNLELIHPSTHAKLHWISGTGEKILKNISEYTRKSWKRPEVRKRRCEGIKKWWQSPDNRKKRMESIKNQWSSEEFRKERSALLKKSWKKRPVYKKTCKTCLCQWEARNHWAECCSSSCSNKLRNSRKRDDKEQLVMNF